MKEEKGNGAGKKHIKNKGGRPSKAIKRNNALTVKCSTLEKSNYNQ